MMMRESLCELIEPTEQGFVTNYSALAGCRFLLGLFEAGVSVFSFYAKC